MTHHTTPNHTKPQQHSQETPLNQMISFSALEFTQVELYPDFQDSKIYRANEMIQSDYLPLQSHECSEKTGNRDSKSIGAIMMKLKHFNFLLIAYRFDRANALKGCSGR